MTAAGDRDAVTAVVIGHVASALKDPAEAPLQGDEGAPEAWLVFTDRFAPALRGLSAGEEVLVLSWLHLADRETLRVHPRGDEQRPKQGVFGTRSPHRPNPIGIHRTSILEVAEGRVRVSGLEAVDGTPILDVKAVLGPNDR